MLLLAWSRSGSCHTVLAWRAVWPGVAWGVHGGYFLRMLPVLLACALIPRLVLDSHISRLFKRGHCMNGFRGR